MPLEIYNGTLKLFSTNPKLPNTTVN